MMVLTEQHSKKWLAVKLVERTDNELLMNEYYIFSLLKAKLKLKPNYAILCTVKKKIATIFKQCKVIIKILRILE